MALDPFSAGASVLGAGLSYYSSRKAAKAQEKAAREAQNIESRQRSQQRSDQAPYRQIGAGATNQLAGLFGIGGVSGYDDRVVGNKTLKPSEVTALLNQGMSIDDVLKIGTLEGDVKTSDALFLMNKYGISADDLGRLKNGTFSPLQTTTGSNSPDYSSFYNNPGYKFQLDQGQQAIERQAAARGGLASGNTLTALQDYSQGLAQQSYNNYVNQLMGLSGVGQNATNALMGADQASSGRISDSAINIGNARASGVVGQGNALADLVGSLGAMGSDWWGGRKQTGVRAPSRYGTGPM